MFLEFHLKTAFFIQAVFLFEYFRSLKSVLVGACFALSNLSLRSMIYGNVAFCKVKNFRETDSLKRQILVNCVAEFVSLQANPAMFRTSTTGE